MTELGTVDMWEWGEVLVLLEIDLDSCCPDALSSYD